MHQEAPNELRVTECHDLAFLPVGIVLVAKAYGLATLLNESMIRDGNSMRVPGQVLEHLLGAAKRPFRVNNPVLLDGRIEEMFKGGWLS